MVFIKFNLYGQIIKNVTPVELDIRTETVFVDT